MPGHDQSSRRVPKRAWFGLMLLALATFASRPTFGEEAIEAKSTTATAGTREPIDLAARQIQVWRQGGDQWVVLSGEAAILQGVEGLRAVAAVVRVVSTPTANGNSYLVDVYAEDVVEPNRPRKTSFRATFRTSSSVKLRPYTSKGLVQLNAPPTDQRLLARSGFAAGPRSSEPPSEPLATNPATAASRSKVSSGSGVTELAVAAPAEVILPVLVEAPREISPPENVTILPAATPDARAKVDTEVVRTQFPGPETTDDPVRFGDEGMPPPVNAPELDSAPIVPNLPPGGAPTELVPLPAPGTENVEAPPARRPRGLPGTRAAPLPVIPISPGSQRIMRIAPRNGGPNFNIKRLGIVDGSDTTVIEGGVNIVVDEPKLGTIDISADSVVIWRRVDAKGASIRSGPNGEEIQDAKQPLEMYLEGDVVVLQDERKMAGNGDQKTYRAKAAFYDLTAERFVGLDAELQMYAPGLVAPVRIMSPRIEQYRPLAPIPGGGFAYGLQQIRADNTVGTGSRFPTPGYRFTSKSTDITRMTSKQKNPNTGKLASDPNAPPDLTWQIDSRQNFFYMGPIPVFYLPRFVADAEDIEPPLRQFTFRTNNYLGQQALSDFNGFRLLSIKKPDNIDIWNVDVDYLSARTKTFPFSALGSEIGWNGNDLINDISDPYHRTKGAAPSITKDYFGYFDIWGLQDAGRDNLGSGPAIITNNLAAGKAGFQRGGGGPKGAVPPFTDPRGRFTFRHMQRFLPDDDEHAYEDLRLQLEVGAYSDRYFLEEYYKRLFDTGMDQETLLYLIRQKQNWAYTIWTEANLQSWQTETQWLPKFDYYRLGDSLLGNKLTFFTHTGIDYASTHTASEVQNANIFAFMPYDPISNTSGTLNAGRAYSNNEVDLPLNFGNIFRLVPYAQGQLVGWSNQINGQSVGRYWGGVGVRAEAMAWKAYPWLNSEMLNVHGINHKINFEADFRDAYANTSLNSIGVQDDLDDNTYESTRRYFALTNYAGGVLPAQYDPRHLILRRAMSPITGTTDIQATMETLHLGIHQRLQTKRGPDGKRRIVDYMTFDLDTTYFPDASRDNYNKPFGQNTYNWQWFVGDRTSIISTGWFEFWNITGNPIYKTNFNRHNDPFGLNVVTTGVSLSRPPRGNIFVGYSVINTGPIDTSALTTSLSYWLSPKWYGTYSTMYDFGNAILLSATFSVTRIGADYLTSVGLNVDPQRQSYMFAFQISPRLSPNMRFGSSSGMGSFDSRYAPTQ